MSETRKEWDAASYHLISNPQFVWGLKVLERLPLQGDETVMDAGCGTGRVTEQILKRLPNGQVIAVDQSENMLSRARESLAKYGDKVTFLQANLLDLPSDVQADRIFSTATFHWVLDHSRLFAGLFNVLTPGGWLIAQCGGQGNLARLYERVNELLVTAPYAPFFRDWREVHNFATAEETASRLDAAGFTEIQTWIEETPTSFPQPSDYREFLTTVNLRDVLARIPGNTLRELLLQSLTAQALKDMPPLTLDYHRLNIIARRPL